ncbi:hypothetical protein DID80_06230 [Candidatus Marinamargulisbacteria bacterium SCGC AAA071-K20]|nr:hypothetical protein DID80_06230 [Candidatus Marinamargulisbacteria bacterium SCGC AAA071-K20]
MIKRLVLIVLILSSIVWAGPSEIAEKHYQDKEYKEAVTLYEGLLRMHPGNAGLLYNLGNSYLKNEQLGLSITMYRKALLIDPRSKTIKTNLGLARKLVLDETSAAQAPLMAWFFGFVNTFTLNEFYCVLLFFVLLLNGLLVARFLDKKPDLVRQCFIAWGIGMALFLIFFVSKINYDSVSRNGVLIVKKIEVKSGPSETLPTLFYIHEGVEFTLLKTVNGWSEIQLSNGYNGWVLEEAYLSI